MNTVKQYMVCMQSDRGLRGLMPRKSTFHLTVVRLICEVCLYVIPSSPAVDCGDPGTPTNGQRTLSSTTYSSVVTYTCNVGYTLQGSNSRTCLSNGQWNGSVPQCISEFCLYFVDTARQLLICLNERYSPRHE